MKKISIIAALLTLCLLFAACGQAAKTTSSEQQKETTTAPQSSETQAKTEVATANSNNSEKAAGYPEFDFTKKTVTLNSGHEMPILGLGMFSLSDSEAENSTYWALKAGFRLIDTAKIYGNEAAVGRGLQRAINEGIVKREDVFITTKMWTSDFSNGDEAINASLEKLGLDYIDLMILHHSQPSNDVDAYKAMERAVESGKLKSIGLSNYYEPDDFDRVVNATTIKPALGSHSAAEATRRRSLTTALFQQSLRRTANHRRRSSSAGICRQAISVSPVRPTNSTSLRTTMFGTLS